MANAVSSRDQAQNLPVTTRFCRTQLLERNAKSNLIKLLFADDESVASSTICEDPAHLNQIQSQNELTNPSKTRNTSENDNVSIQGCESDAKKRSKIR